MKRLGVAPAMSSHSEWVAALGVLAVFVIGVALNWVLSARPKQAQAVSMVGMYASHEGNVVGEVVAVTSDRVILLQGGVHKAVPKSQSRVREGDVFLEGAVDWAKAEEEGRAWAAAALGAA
jgi:hypothetical protein